jgi:hypothetical protein
MPKKQDSLNADLARQLARYKPVARASSGDKVPVPEEADVFQFKFTLDGEDYGTVSVSIDGLHKLVVYDNEDVQHSPKYSKNKDLTWEQLLVSLKNFAHGHQLSFKVKANDDLEPDMAKREHTKLDESYRPMGKKTSVNDSVPTVKVRIQHSREMNEGEQRFRHIDKIFIENANGERFLLDTKRPGIARVFARHIAEGGRPYDERWNHIGSLVEEYTKMAGFVRATRGGQFNESTSKLVNEGVNHYMSLRETLHKLAGGRGYNNYFESWSPPLMEDESNEDLSEMFMSSSLDPRIESAMPILNKLNKNLGETKLAEVQSLEEWAEDIVENALIPKTPGQIDDLMKLLTKENLPFGADAMNIKNELDNILHDDDLFAELEQEAQQDSDADAKECIVSWMKKQNNPEYQTVIDKLTTEVDKATSSELGEAEKEADYGNDYQSMVKRVGQKAKEQEKKKPVNLDNLAKRLRAAMKNDETSKVKEELDPEQKSAGQLGPTEKVKNNNIGKLVGASESIDPELSRIRKLSGL